MTKTVFRYHVSSRR